MTLPTEAIGSLPRTPKLLEGMRAFAAGTTSGAALDALFEEAVRDTIGELEATGSPVISDGEQSKPSFVTYPLQGLSSLRPDGVTIPFKDGHGRQLPLVTRGPFRYQVHADRYLAVAKKFARRPVKQAVISASALSLLYPETPIADYPRDAFLADVIDEAEADIRACLDGGADSVQIDFTEGRLSLKLDPSQGLLKAFVALNNRVLERFTAEERRQIGVHTCPGGDQDSTHSADVDYAQLLPDLFRLNVGRFYVQLASEADPTRVLHILRDHVQPGQRVFVGVTDPIDPRVETPELVRDRILAAAKIIDPAQLGSTDDCGFSPFGDDVSTSRQTALAKIRARVQGNELASKALGV